MADTFNKCSTCGGKIEQARPGLRICYGCHLDRLIPYDYQSKELYVFDLTWGRSNATVHPETGVPILDDNRPLLREIAAKMGAIRTEREGDTPYM